MLIILAKGEDQGAMWLANRWRSHGATMITPADLSNSGWSLHLGAPRQSMLRAGGRDISNDAIRGVVTRISCVTDEDLHHIVPSDRQYVASEMTAFLLFWLSSLAVPVLNRPTPGNLAGPGWRNEQWTHLAAGLGIPVQPTLRRVPNRVKPFEPKSACEVTVVGEQCLGHAAPVLIRNAQTLAKAAGTCLLSVRFAGSAADSAFLSARPWPDLTSPRVADAVLHELLEERKC